ncbi:MAG: hypothetical protein GY861_09920 [bacterium]|nr:hypothetical protein [bacterium]
MLKNKKSELSTTPNMVIVAIVAVFLVGFYLHATSGVAHAASDNFCRFSALQRDVVRVPGTGTILTDLDCKTRFVNIQEEGAEIVTSDTPKGEWVPYRDEDPELSAKETIAKEMQGCWYSLGEGKIDPFSDWGTSDKKCVMCSEITFSYEFQEEVDTLHGFIDFLKSEKAKGKQEYYAEYLFGTNDIDTTDLYQELSTDKSYHIMYIVTYKESFDDLKSSMWESTLEGASAGATIGSFIVPLKGTLIGGAVGAAVGVVGGTIKSAFHKSSKEKIPSMWLAPAEATTFKCDKLY